MKYLFTLLALVFAPIICSAQVVVVKAGADGKVFEPAILTLTTPVITGGFSIAGAISPATNDGSALGSASLSFSDLFLASGAVINYANGNVALTHTSGVLTLGTGNLIITTAGTAAGSVVTNSGTQTLTNKTLTTPALTTPALTTPTVASSIAPVTNDTATLGTASLSFSDLFLASGAVINYANGNAVLTHTSGVLTLGTGNLIVTTAGTATGSVVTTTGTQTLTAKTLTAPVITAGVVTPAVTTISGDGAITIASGVVLLTKAGVAAITIAAPSSQDGTRITIMSNSDNAHVVTFTGTTLLDGTTGANITATFAAFKGASITVVAVGSTWLVESLNEVTPSA